MYIGAQCVLSWRDTPTEYLYRYLSFGAQVADSQGDIVSDSFDVSDLDIFFYCDTYDEFLEIFKNGSDDFIVKEYSLVTASD